MRRHWLVACCGLCVLFAGLRLAPHPSLREQIASSSAVFDADGRLLRLTLAADQQYRLWTPLSQVAPDFTAALLLHEDRHFRWHPGVNPAALLRAAAATYGGGARQGGSTVTMQLARLLYGLNTRTPAGKLRQIAAALWLELRYSKHDILEAEINLLPYGQNIQGVGAASLVYFGKTPDHLTLPEALALVLIPQSPAARAPEGQEPAGLRTARLRLFGDWQEAHPQAREVAELMQPPLRFRSLEQLPFAAPHLCDALLEVPGHEPAIRTTLDSALQRLLEERIRSYVRRESRIGIVNASALLVDTRDLAVKALVGSADFFDGNIEGQVDGVFAKRSPGSALKPFLYALAMDQGLVHPQSVLKDAPVAFGPFAPENFDGSFAGPITVHDALIRSRNIPAVALAARLAQPDFYDFLKLAGISRMASREHYGLALTLGGGEVTMEEMARLYAMLANRGLLRPLRYRVDEPQQPGLRLLSEEASFMVRDILQDNPRPDAVAAQPVARLSVAWKTGTSWGFRDAWTAGLFGPYALVVWIGNFDGSGNPAFVGAQAAAPLFFEIVDAVQAQRPNLREPPWRVPSGLVRVQVCSASGDLPNADCPQTSPTWFIPGKSPIRLSNVHRRVLVNLRTGRQACAGDPAQDLRSEVYEFWPSDLQRLFAQAGMPRRRPPPPGDCAPAAVAGTPPAITSPLSGATYTLRTARLGHEAVQLSAIAEADVRSLYWFVGGSFVASAGPAQSLPWVPPGSGRYQLRVVDDHGRADSRELRVEVAP
ncbi:MAG: penicillin-binding protein 1C [Nevskia sp.]|nr:penicillin-binding protein 1C [Nevskia sp.]